MPKTQEVVLALLKAKPLYALLATFLTMLGVTQGEAIVSHLQALMALLIP